MLFAGPAVAVDLTIGGGSTHEGDFSSPGGTVTVTGEGSTFEGAVTAGRVIVQSGGTATIDTANLESAHGGSLQGVAHVVDGELVVDGGRIANVRTNGWGNAVYAGAGSNVQLNGVELSTSGTNPGVNPFGSPSSGVFAHDGAQVVLNGGSVAATGAVRGLALQTEGGMGEVITANNVEISASGTLSVGVLAYGDGDGAQASTININGGTIDVAGEDAVGVQAEKLDARINLVGTQVTTTGAGGIGVTADRGAVITLADTSITTSGSNADGIYSWLYSGEVRSNISGSNVTVSTSGQNADGVVADDSDVSLVDAVITTSGRNAVGALATQGGTITLEGGSVTTTGTGANGLVSTLEGSRIETTNTAVTVSGTGAAGARANEGGSIVLTGGSVSAASRALYADGGTITAANVAITNAVADNNVDETGAVYAINGGTVTLSGGSIETSGGRQSGLFALRSASIDATDVAINVSGDRGRGVYAHADSDSSGTVVLDGGSITTNGFLSHGLFAKRESGSTGNMLATISATDVEISVDGDDANGVYAAVGGDITVTGGSVSASGLRGIGLHAQASDSGMTGGGVLSATNVAVTTSGVDGLGVFAQDGGEIVLNGGSVTTTGAGGHALVTTMNGAPGDSTIVATDVTIKASGDGAAAAFIAGDGLIQISNSTLESGAASLQAFVVDGSQAVFSIIDSVVSSTGGDLFTADRSLDINGTGVASILLVNGTSATGNISDLGTKTSGYTDLTVEASQLQGGVYGVRNLLLSDGASWTATGAGDIDQIEIGVGGAALNAASDIRLDGILTGSGDLAKGGAGQVELAGDGHAYAGTLSINDGDILLTGSLGGTVVINANGTLQVGDGQTDGDLLADTVNNGTLIFDQIADYDYTGALSGSGGLEKRGDNVLTLSGDYSYTGSTVIQGGLVKVTSQLSNETELDVGNGTLDLSDTQQEVSALRGTGGTLALGTTGSLTVNQTDDTEFAGNITGSGAFIKDGNGSLNLTGNSDFTGQMDVNGGRLAVNGSLPGSIVVNQGAVLGGNGTVGQINANNGATVAPGNSIGTLHVTGDVNFAAGSVFEVEVDAAGNSDKIIATGTAYIDGAEVSVLAAAGNYRWTSDYVILSAAEGIEGRFGDPDVDLPFLAASLSYEPTDVVLTLTRNDRTFASAAVTANQAAVAGALDGSPQESDLYRAVSAQTDEANAQRAFEALSGELWGTTATFMIDQSRRSGELVLGRLQQADVLSSALANSGSAASSSRDGTAIWGQVIGSWNKVQGNGTNAGGIQDQIGFLTGLDTSVGDWRIGAAVGHTEGKVHVNALASHAKVQSTTASIYAGGGWNALRVRAGATYGWHDIGGDRTVAFQGFSEDVTGATDGRSISGFGELSYAARLGNSRIEPFAGINYVNVRTDAFDETGQGAALGIGKIERDVTFSTLGLRLGTDLPVTDRASITPRVSVAWQHAFGDVQGRSDNVLSTGESFRIAGLPVSKNAALIEAGFQANIMPGGSIGAAYVGNLSDRWKDHGLRIGLSYQF